MSKKKVRRRKFVFSTGETRGSYTSVDANGEEHEAVGLDMFLGISEGNTPRDALVALLKRGISRKRLPYGMPDKICVWEVRDNGRWMNVGAALKSAEKQLAEDQKEVKILTEKERSRRKKSKTRKKKTRKKKSKRRKNK